MERMAKEVERREADAIDLQTFQRFQNGDPDAMNAVVLAYHRRLIGYLETITHRTEVAEELAQEVFIAAWHQRRDVYGPDKLKPWLFTLARRKALKEMAHKHYTSELGTEDGTMEGVSAAVPGAQQAAVLDGQMDGHLQRAIGELSPQERDLVLLRYYGGLQIQELAQTLGMPMGTVGVKLGRTLQKIRRILESKGLRAEDMMP